MRHIPVCRFEVVFEANPFHLCLWDILLNYRQNSLSLIRKAKADFFNDAVFVIF